jgi:hypothetical protein
VVECDVCKAKVSETRRGRCWGCYNRWVDARPVGFGAKCITCGERRRRMLRGVELWGGWQPMCFNCTGQALALHPLPDNVVDLKQAMDRERRAIERRSGKPDTRVFQYERRVGQRRADRDDRIAAIDDDMIIEIVVDPGEVDFEDMTRIRELPTGL